MLRSCTSLYVLPYAFYQVVMHIHVPIAIVAIRLSVHAHKTRSVPRCCIVVHVQLFTITCALCGNRGRGRRVRHPTIDAGFHPVELRSHP